MRPESPARARARQLYADQIGAMGKAWLNTAGLIRTGFENIWITPALDAIESLVLLYGDADDEDAEASP